MIVLVTGSRKLESDALPTIYEALREVSDGLKPPHILIHGAAEGADTLTSNAAFRLGWVVRPRPADWYGACVGDCGHGPRRRDRSGRLYCPAQGGYRNQAMVDEVMAEVEAGHGPAVCIVLYKRGAKHKGTSDCLARATRAGILKRRWTA